MSWIAQASYALLDLALPGPALAVPTTGGFTDTQVARLLDGGQPLDVLNHKPNNLGGFSATLLWDPHFGAHVLGIRGTDDEADLIQDAELLVAGFAADQLISLYRYYRCLTTPAAEHVSYTSDEVTLLQQLNEPIPLLPVGGSLGSSALLLALSTDRGLGILQPGEEILVAGHSLGGHLALLFGRAFPSITEGIYTFNAPGIAPWGNALLSLAGLSSSDPSKVVNIAAAQGIDAVAAFGTRPGQTQRIFIEAGGPLLNHSVVQLSDSLALHDLFAALSPSLGVNVETISAILAASSATPAKSLETALDMLGRVLEGNGSVTPIATTAADQAARDAYYAKLYDLRDRLADGHDWDIQSLAGKTAAGLLQQAGNVAYRHALSDLTPFVILGASYGDPLASLSTDWLSERAEFLAHLLNARSADLMYVVPGAARSKVFIDVGRGEQVSVLDTALLGQIEAVTSPLTSADLANLEYDERATFGGDAPDNLIGSTGNDALFGGGGDDLLSGLSGRDILEGGEGNDLLTGSSGDDKLTGGSGDDTLIGGSGYDTYILNAGGGNDRLQDSDGNGEIRLGGRVLTGGLERADGRFQSTDGLHLYELSGGTLTIDESIVVDGFFDGALGIHLGQTRIPAPLIEPDYVYSGERILLLSDVRDEYNNYVATGAPTPGTFDEFLFGRPGEVLFTTGAGNDYVAAGLDGNNWLLLGGGDDFGFGGEGNDWIEGGAQGDGLLGGRGDDVLYAEAATDEIEAPLPPRVPIDLPIFPFDNVSGGEGSDTIFGSAYRDYLEGGAGADQITAGAGNDVVFADGYAYSVHAGEEYDAFSLAVPAGTFTIDHLANIRGIDWLFPGNSQAGGTKIPISSDNTLPAHLLAFTDSDAGGDDIVHAGAGNDAVFAGVGHDVAYGGGGNDLLHGAAGNDRLFGEDGDDTLDGQDGDDTLVGGAGRDALTGSGGNDTLLAGDGADTLGGGPGADWLDGGGVSGVGSDQHVFGEGDTLVFRRAPGQVLPDGTFPTGVTIHFSEEFSPEDIWVSTAFFDPSPHWLLVGGALNDAFRFQGTLSEWSGIQGTFADGTLWNHTDFVAHSVGYLDLALAPLSTSHGTASNDIFMGTEGSDRFSGGAGDDHYRIGRGGHDEIEDSSGSDSVAFRDVQSTGVTVLVSGDDYLLRYPGGELRLVGQTHADAGVESVSFEANAAVWTRADLDARAIPFDDPQAAPLGVQVATPGQAFSYVFGEDVFAAGYALGDTTYEISSLEGEPLPTWLEFDADERRFSGTPGAGDVGATALLVAQNDALGLVTVTPLVISVEAPVEEGPAAASPFQGLIKLLPPMLDVARALVTKVAAVPAAPMGLAIPAAFGMATPVDGYGEFEVAGEASDSRPAEPLPLDEMMQYDAAPNAWSAATEISEFGL